MKTIKNMKKYMLEVKNLVLQMENLKVDQYKVSKKKHQKNGGVKNQMLVSISVSITHMYLASQKKKKKRVQKNICKC